MNLDDAFSCDDQTHAHQYMYERHLQELFIKHKLSANTVQKTADFSTKAGAAGVDKYVKAGKSGALKSNVHRDLVRSMKAGSSMPEPYFVATPVYDEDTNKTRMAWIPVLLMHEILFWLISIGRLSLELICGSSLPENSGQWSSASKFCTEQNIPFDSTIPIGFHGDGVPFAKNQSVEVLS